MNKKTQQKRYGKYPFYYSLDLSCILVIVYGIYVFIRLRYEYTEAYLGFVPVFLSICALIQNHHPYTEKFFVSNNIIHHQKGKNIEQINIPDDAVFVFSYMVVKFYFKKKYMINIVSEDSDLILKKLHQDDYWNELEMAHHKLSLTSYNNKIINGVFRHRCCYCFKYEKDYAEKFFAEQQKPIIIPRSIADKIDLDMEKFNVIIDEKG